MAEWESDQRQRARRELEMMEGQSRALEMGREEQVGLGGVMLLA
jgi:hypothetical protein